MSVFGPNQVGELIIGTAVAAETKASTFVATASDKEIQIVPKNGSALAAGKDFYAVQKTTDDASVLGYEFSDKIGATSVESISLGAYVAEAPKEVSVSGFTGAVKPNSTYEVMVRLYNDGGSLSVENFRIIPGFYVTGASGDTNTQIVNGIVDSLNRTEALSGSKNFTFANVSNNKITIVGKVQKGSPAKNQASPIEFDVQVAVKSNSVDQTTGLPEIYNVLTVTVDESGTPGVGTGKYVANYEWFTKGVKYEAYRDSGYPVNFDTPYYANYNGAYNIIEISYFSQRNSTNVERQYKNLSIAVAVDPASIATNSVTNAVLAKLRVVLGSTIVPANLAVS
jgi:hypothetical protein